MVNLEEKGELAEGCATLIMASYLSDGIRTDSTSFIHADQIPKNICCHESMTPLFMTVEVSFSYHQSPLGAFISLGCESIAITPPPPSPLLCLCIVPQILHISKAQCRRSS